MCNVSVPSQFVLIFFQIFDTYIFAQMKYGKTVYQYAHIPLIVVYQREAGKTSER